MLERAWELKVAIRKWLAATENRDRYSMLQLKEADWGRVEELLEILRPMEQVTALVGTTKSVTIHAVFRLYNHVFNHLEANIAYWEASEKQYAKEYLQALNAARDKLDEHYSRTDGSRGTIFNLATLLDPHTKLLVYSDKVIWGTTLQRRYVNEFHKHFNDNYAPRARGVPQEPIAVAPARPAVTQLQGLAAIGSVKRSAAQARSVVNSESVEYLKTAESEITADNPTGDPLRAWPALESSYPNLASMAKDILAVPASGVGVEREFNSARDIITYRRCRMKPDLIEDLMILKHHAILNNMKGSLSEIVASAESLVENESEITFDFAETSAAGMTEDRADSAIAIATASQDDWDYEHMVEWTDTEDANSSADDSGDDWS